MFKNRPVPIGPSAQSRIRRGDKPSPTQVQAAIEYLYQVPYLDAVAMAKSPLDLHAAGEEFIWHLRRLKHGIVDAIGTIDHYPEIGEFYSFEYGCARYLIEGMAAD